MASWLHELGLYIYAVLAHWQALATGGFVTAVVSVVEKRRSKSLSWESYATIMAVFVLYSFFAAWQDEHRNTGSVISDKTVLSSQLGSCQGTVQSTQSSLREKETIADAFQKAFVAMQGPQAQQQANIASCITNLAKMNPQIHESIHTIIIHIASRGQSIAGGQVDANLMEALFTTNIRENTFHGKFRCDVPFQIVRPVEVPTEAEWMVGSHPAPKALSDREYEVRIEMSNSVWDVEHPAHLGMISHQALNSCSFEKME